MKASRIFGAVATALLLSAAPAAAQANWPERAINLVVGFGAGGGTDIIARIVATALTEELGQPVVVVNRPGAGGTVAAESVASSPRIDAAAATSGSCSSDRSRPSIITAPACS